MSVIVDYPAIDYLRLSVRGDAIERVESYFAGIEGEREHRQIMQYKGQRVRGVFFGYAYMMGEVWGLVDIPGCDADEHTKHFVDTEAGLDCRCTRIDYQLTLPEPPMYDAFALRKSLMRCTSRDVGIMGVEKDGMTVSVGKRKTGKFIRIYQKSIETKFDKERYLRFEVEYTGGMSRSCWNGNPLLTCGAIRAELHDLNLSGYCLDVLAPFVAVVENHHAYKVRRIKPVPAAAKWLDESVFPCVLRMLNSHDKDDSQFVEMWITRVYERLQQWRNKPL